jgi:hypothetical protein
LGAGGLVKSFDPIAEKDLSPNHDSLWDGYGFAVASIIAGNVDDIPVDQALYLLGVSHVDQVDAVTVKRSYAGISECMARVSSGIMVAANSPAKSTHS